MNEAEKLEREYQRKLKKLQKSCPHKRVGDWVPEWSVDARYPTGYILRICARCRKRVKCIKDGDKLYELLAKQLNMTIEEVHRAVGPV